MLWLFLSCYDTCNSTVATMASNICVVFIVIDTVKQWGLSKCRNHVKVSSIKY